MPAPRSPTAQPFDLNSVPVMAWGAKGLRAIVEFAPKPTSTERLIAGVVTKLDDGPISYACALDARKMEHAFGDDGVAMHAIAQQLCESLMHHWTVHGTPANWNPPFTGANLAEVSRFSSRSVEELQSSILNRTSSLHTLMASYEIAEVKRATSIVERVRSAVKKNNNTKHSSKRFNRELNLGEQAGAMRVDFLGQHYACYFLQITHSARGLEINTERAYGKLFELEALQRFVRKPKKTLGLLEDERPQQFELVMVGDRNDAIQRRAIYQVEALADRKETRVRTLASAKAAAEHVSDRERLAA